MLEFRVISKNVQKNFRDFSNFVKNPIPTINGGTVAFQNVLFIQLWIDLMKKGQLRERKVPGDLPLSARQMNAKSGKC